MEKIACNSPEFFDYSALSSCLLVTYLTGGQDDKAKQITFSQGAFKSQTFKDITDYY